MHKVLVLFLLAASAVSAQSAPATQPATTPNQAAKPDADKEKAAEAQEAPEVPPNAPVITLHGLCPDKPAGTDPKSPDCQTVVTRADFEHLVQTLAPTMPPSAKQQLAGDYSRMLVLSEEARKRGLDKTARFNDILSFMKMRILAQELLANVQEKAKPTQAEIEKYYQDNQAKYQELTLKRLFIPRNPPAADDKKAGEPKAKTDAELQAEGERMRARLAAGEDFDKVQKEAYEAAGFKTPPPPTTIPNWRHDAVPPQQQQLFELKKGELSKVIVEPAGAYAYRVEETTTSPLEQVKPEIESQLANQHMQQQMEALTGTIKPEINQAYFRGMTGGERDREVHALTPPANQETPKASPTLKTSPTPKASPTKPKSTTPKASATPKK